MHLRKKNDIVHNYPMEIPKGLSPDEQLEIEMSKLFDMYAAVAEGQNLSIVYEQADMLGIPQELLEVYIETRLQEQLINKSTPDPDMIKNRIPTDGVSTMLKQLEVSHANQNNRRSVIAS